MSNKNENSNMNSLKNNDNQIFPYLYNVPLLKPKNIIKEAHKNPIYCVKFSNDGDYCLSGSQDRTIKLWNPFKELLIRTYDKIHSNDVLDIAIAKDNTKFASVGLDKQVFLTDSIKCNLLRRFPGHLQRINSVCFDSDESLLISGSYDCSVKIWDLKSQNRDPIQTLSEAKDSISKVFALKEKIISISIDGSLRIYDIRMGSMIRDDQGVSLNGMDVSNDEKFYCISGTDDCLRLIEDSTGEIIKVFAGLHKSQHYAKAIKFSSDNFGVFTTSENNDIVYYDLVDEKKDKILRGHSKNSSGLDIHPKDKNILITSGFDCNLILWDLNQKIE